MATLQTFIILIISLTFVIYLGYAGDYQKYGFKSEISNVTKGQLDSLNSSFSDMNQLNLPINLNPFNGAISFPNPFSIFFDVLGILKTIVFAPIAVIGSLDFPTEIKFGLQIIFFVTMVYLVYTWFKGQTA